ncbi:MAG: phytase, partial [Planctomycetales bacterium]|nr:phytase [Planctomycetales bacterium]
MLTKRNSWRAPSARRFIWIAVGGAIICAVAGCSVGEQAPLPTVYATVETAPVADADDAADDSAIWIDQADPAKS